MLKLFVLAALVAVSAAAPGIASYFGIGAGIGSTSSEPAAVPYVAAPAVAAPIAYAAPLAYKSYGAPLYSAYAAAPIAYKAGYVSPYGYIH